MLDYNEKRTTKYTQRHNKDYTRFNVETPSMTKTTTGQSPKQSNIKKGDTTQIQALLLDTIEKSRYM